MNNGTPPGDAPNNNNKRHPALAPFLSKSLITKKIPAPHPEDVERTKKAAADDAKKGELCIICQEALPDIERGIIACGHTFCFGCIHTWSCKSGNSVLCPSCRVPFSKIKKTLSPKDMEKEKLRNERDKNRKNTTKKQRNRMRRRAARVTQPVDKIFVKDVRVRKMSKKKKAIEEARTLHPDAAGGSMNTGQQAMLRARQLAIEAMAVQRQAALAASRARRDAELRAQHQAILTAAHERQRLAREALAEAQARQAAGTRARLVVAAKARAEQRGASPGVVSEWWDSVAAAAATPAAAAAVRAATAAAATAAAAPAAAAPAPAAAPPSGAAATRGPRMRYTVAGFTNNSIMGRGRSFASAAEAALFSAGHASFAAAEAAEAAAAAAAEPARFSNSSILPISTPRGLAIATATATRSAGTAAAAATAARPAAAAAQEAERLRAQRRATERVGRLGDEEEQERSQQREQQQQELSLERTMAAVHATAARRELASITQEAERLRAQRRAADRSRRLGEVEEEERSRQRERQQEEARRGGVTNEAVAAAVAAAAAEVPSRMDLLARLAGLQEPMPARRAGAAGATSPNSSASPSISATARVTRSATRNTRSSSSSASATATEVVRAAPTWVSPRRRVSGVVATWLANARGGGGGDGSSA
ncbi:unnamed protein product [Ectocarpus sp. 4 AP-2014]